MKSFAKGLVLIFAAVFLLAATCENIESIESLEASADTTFNFANLAQIEWHLREVLSDFKTGGRALAIDRDDLKRKGLEKAFTLTISSERIGGVAAPNTYGAPYTLGDKQTITIQPLFSTMMAPLFELDALNEHDYLQYLQSAYKWSFAKGQLLIFCKDSAGAEVVLVFTPKD